MGVVDVAVWAACLVLVASGATKVVDPSAFAAALSALRGAPVPDGVGVVTGAAEVVVGVVAMAVGGPVVALVVGCAYLVFAAVVVAARARGLRSCGCFGRRSGPPSLLHAALNATSAAVALAAAATGGAPAVADGLADAGAWTVPAVLATLALSGAVVALETR